ncbi:uncharacterized protein BT62DRAFT_946908 [Guyanagaster necrorhizus]|uniref:Uncharacterized protein n=1 Tax=Guyanagaster necrorhizus TaxID=856835 RepID=A0A9P7VVB9_9AGAR|nr:uncharacterized protein BT62DRAFT_946908 [Guyanagaster necrorhizus MCA 3950]KAG7448033.1 hypothetical protein BT62DRAFT_946908 [Guyanagaster necrorhizus MCA 3950]
MPVSIDIVTLAPSLDMYGDPDSSSAYSLSGHVTVSLHSPNSIFERRRTTSFLLQSLELTFEGQSEIVAPQIGYSGIRLCSITRQLVSTEPLELSNEGQEESNAPCRWNLVFNIPIPGWLPASSKYGVDDMGTSYTLYATAKFLDLDNTSPWSLSALCAPFRSREREVHAEKTIPIRRFVDSQFLDPAEVPLTTFLVNSKTNPPKRDDDRPRIPQEIISKLQILASIPEYVDVLEDSIDLTLRMRVHDLEEEQCRRLQLSAFAVNVLQREKCRHRPSAEYRRRFPLPSESQQPPNIPLRSCHRLGYLYDGFYSPPINNDAAHIRTFSLLPSEENGEYILGDHNYVFAHNVPGETPIWYTLQTSIPFIPDPDVIKRDESSDWIGLPSLRPTGSSPLLTFRHEVCISLMIGYDLPDQNQQATETLTFAIPLRFAHVPPPPPPSARTCPLPALSQSMIIPSAESLPAISSEYSETALPAYSQLFHSNGDRKLDSTPLPLYTAHEQPCPSESTSANPDEPCEPSDRGHKVEHADDDDNSSETTPLL